MTCIPPLFTVLTCSQSLTNHTLLLLCFWFCCSTRLLNSFLFPDLSFSFSQQLITVFSLPTLSISLSLKMFFFSASLSNVETPHHPPALNTLSLPLFGFLFPLLSSCQTVSPQTCSSNKNNEKKGHVKDLEVAIHWNKDGRYELELILQPYTCSYNIKIILNDVFCLNISSLHELVVYFTME